MTTYSEKLKDPRWQKKRLDILVRDKWTCQFCGDSKSTLHVHHIVRYDDPWDTPDDHLITLCFECHKDEEEKLKDIKQSIFSELQSCGFVANMLCRIPLIFMENDRGWNGYEPAIDILKMVVDDDDVWRYVEETFWKKLSEKRKNGV